MPSYKVLGINSFAENLKEITHNEPVILKHEKYNIKSKNAIGIYTKNNNKKLGYFPTENSDELSKFNNSYVISKLQLNQDYPIVEISRSYPTINTICNYEFNFIKNIKYDYILIDPPTTLTSPLTSLINSLKRKRIIIKRVAVTYLDDNYINIIIETSKGIETFYTITLIYFKENKEKYEELLEYNLIDNIFFKELCFHRPEKYIEINYTNILNYTINEQYTFIEIKSVESLNNKIDIDLIYFTKLYLYCTINKDFKYVIKYLNKFSKKKYDTVKIIKKCIDNYTNIDLIFNDYNIELGKFFYDHTKQIYSEIEFMNDDTVFIISDKLSDKYLLNCYLSNKTKLIVYNPLNGILYESLYI